jgi:hypothetical protein
MTIAVEDSPDDTNENLIDMPSAASIINKVFDFGWKLSGTALKIGPMDQIFSKELCAGEKRFENLYWQVQKVAQKVINCQDMRSVNVIILATTILSKGARSNTSPHVVVEELAEQTTFRGASKEGSNIIKSPDVTSKFQAFIYRVFENDVTIPHRDNGIGKWHLLCPEALDKQSYNKILSRMGLFKYSELWS